MCDEINKKLVNNIVRSNKNKSSYWKKKLTDDADYLNPFSHLAFGSYRKKNIKNYIQNLLARVIFGNNVFKTKTYFAYKFVFDTGTEMTSNSDEFEIVIDDEESFEFYFDGVRDRGITTLEELEEWVIQADE